MPKITKQKATEIGEIRISKREIEELIHKQLPIGSKWWVEQPAKDPQAIPEDDILIIRWKRELEPVDTKDGSTRYRGGQ